MTDTFLNQTAAQFDPDERTEWVRVPLVPFDPTISLTHRPLVLRTFRRLKLSPSLSVDLLPVATTTARPGTAIRLPDPPAGGAS